VIENKWIMKKTCSFINSFLISPCSAHRGIFMRPRLIIFEEFAGRAKQGSDGPENYQERAGILDSHICAI
jgi:hypothetical protein